MADTTGTQQDRRVPGEEGRRYNVSWNLRAGHRQAGTIRGQILNVSLSGVLMRVPAKYPVESIIEIEISPSVLVFIRAVVQIKREQCASSGAYEYGAVFLHMEPEDTATFRETLLQVRRDEFRGDFVR